MPDMQKEFKHAVHQHTRNDVGARTAVRTGLIAAIETELALRARRQSDESKRRLISGFTEASGISLLQLGELATRYQDFDAVDRHDIIRWLDYEYDYGPALPVRTDPTAA